MSSDTVSSASGDDRSATSGPTATTNASHSVTASSSTGDPPDLLHDPKNCGWVGHDCLDQPCTEGRCADVVVADACNPGDFTDNVSPMFPCGANSITGIVLQESNLVWLLGGEGIGYGALFRANKQAGPTSTLQKLIWRPGKIVLDGADALFGYGDGIGRLAPGQATTTLQPADNPENLQLAGTDSVVWSRMQRQFWRMALPDGSPTLVVDLDPMITAAFNYAIRDFVVVDDAIVYADCRNKGIACTIQKVPLDGSPITVLATDQRYASCVAVKDGEVYWSLAPTVGVGEVAIHKVAFAGGNVATLTTLQNQTVPGPLMVDGNSLYSVNSAGLVRIDRTLGVATQAANVVGGIPGHSCQRLATDDSFVYFGDARTVRRVAK